jgi:hypothetical protein
MANCVGEGQLYEAYFGCGAEYNAYSKCVASVPPAASNWDCSFPGFPATPVGDNCAQEITDLYVCAGFI